jgi:hypothetical protein
MGRFFHIRSSQFPILPGEEQELVNAGTYGKALAQYLQRHLQTRGQFAPFLCCEDWGWWVELRGAPFTFGACIYARPDQKVPEEYVCTEGAASPRPWVWKQLRFVDSQPWVQRLETDLESIFQADDNIQLVAITDSFPW